jgi:ketosteroid isomerase-like protein
MRKHFSLIIVVILGVIVSGLSLSAGGAVTDPQHQAIADQIIARERAAIEAWQRKDKAFYAEYMADDSTYFGAMNPYLEVDPKVNFLPKFEQYAEQFKMIDYQMYNPRVQVYGDTAILTYNNAAMVSVGGQTMNYTGKITAVYVKQGNTWRVVHGHESMNPGAK